MNETNILLSEELIAELAQLGKVERMILSFNRTTQEIALEPAAGPQKPGSYKLSWRSVSASAFYRHFKISARGRFPARIVGGRIVISLNLPLRQPGRLRGKIWVADDFDAPLDFLPAEKNDDADR